LNFNIDRKKLKLTEKGLTNQFQSIIFVFHSWLKDTVALTDIPVGGYGFFILIILQNHCFFGSTSSLKASLNSFPRAGWQFALQFSGKKGGELINYFKILIINTL
jgi:hypothetical protein